MELGTLLVLLLVLACPLMMLFMHRGGHASHAGTEQAHGAADETSVALSLDELRSRRDELDVEIAELERAESETKSPAVV